MEIGIAGWALNRSIRQDKSLTLLDFPRLAREEFGVGIIELVSALFENQSAKYLNQLREELVRYNLQVANIAVDTGTLSSSDAASRRTEIEAIKQWFHVAAALNAGAIRVNTGHADADDKDALKRVIDGYRELVDHGSQSSVRVLIENHGGVSSDPVHLRQILEGVDSPWFGTCPDVNNFPGDTWEEGMRIMAPRASVVHVKVAGYDPAGWQDVTSRDGSKKRFNVKRCLAILKETGYKGPLNFEYNHAESDELEGIRRGINYTRELLTAL